MPTKKLETSGTIKAVKKNYSETEKIETLKAFEREEFNYMKTARKTGVSVTTIKKWYNDPKYQSVFSDNQKNKTIRRIELKAQKEEEKILDKYYETKSDILDLAYKRLKELIPNCNNIEHLLKCIDMFSNNDNNNQLNSNSISFVTKTLERLTIIDKNQ